MSIGVFADGESELFADNGVAGVALQPRFRRHLKMTGLGLGNGLLVNVG